MNKNAGRDHWARSMAVVLAGGGFQRFFVFRGSNFGTSQKFGCRAVGFSP